MKELRGLLVDAEGMNRQHFNQEASRVLGAIARLGYSSESRTPIPSIWFPSPHRDHFDSRPIPQYEPLAWYSFENPDYPDFIGKSGDKTGSLLDMCMLNGREKRIAYFITPEIAIVAPVNIIPNLTQRTAL